MFNELLGSNHIQLLYGNGPLVNWAIKEKRAALLQLFVDSFGTLDDVTNN